MKSIIIFVLCVVFSALPAFATTIEGYDRAKLADENYARMHWNELMPEALNDPELAAVMKKYIYGYLSRQIKLTNTERQLITIVVLATSQNHKFLKRAVEGSLSYRALYRISESF